MIGRRLLVRSDSTLAALHDTIQIAFGWTDSHLHRFRIHGRDQGVGRVGGPSFPTDARQVRLDSFDFRLMILGARGSTRSESSDGSPWSRSEPIPSVSAGDARLRRRTAA